ncbi:response regulator transcription factor [Streptomyces sp. LP11]|uniref:Response regulator transcription factor n=1 Tax=Streptomyces pyxinicus TaxID=2970331 RepID=A0ABT2B153_9ACTN|nr:response regulator transcription factor [Streptomyces sp. LP11]MCS0602242.1 response regulator transcription factor [Streptomyces sp. LP11]
MIRVLVADDEPLIRAGIRMILSSCADIEVVAEAADGREAVTLARELRVDVAVLDIQMPVMDGLTALAELRRTVPEVRVLMLTTFGEQRNVLRALTGGGAGFLLKDSAPPDLIRAVQAAAAGQAYLSPATTRRVVDLLAADDTVRRAERARALLERLTGRERDVLALLGEGLSNADVGRRIHMSEGTIKSYVSRILTKLDCENRVQAALLARDAELRGEPTDFEP